MRRLLSLCLPMWATDRVMRRLGRPIGGGRSGCPAVVLAASRHGQRVVAACCGRAAGAGVRVGMTLAHARALLPAGGVHVEDHRPEGDERALERMAAWATHLAPLVAADPPDGLLMDVTGCVRLYGGEDRLIEAVCDAVDRLGFAVRAAVGPTIGSAWALARFGSHPRLVVCEEELAEALAPLPVRSLRLEEAVVDELAEVGIERVEQLMDVPREELAGRFGSAVLLRMDQAMGHAMEVIQPVRPDPPPSVERVFAGPVTQYEAIERTARDLVAGLVETLRRRESGARRISLDVERYEAPPLREIWTLSHPSRDVRHLWSLMRPRVERLHMGYGIERMTLRAAGWNRLIHEQGRWDHAEDRGDRGGHERRMAEAEGRLVDLMRSRLGADAVLRCELTDSHVPEAAFAYRPATETPAKGEHTPLHRPRPTVLLARPVPAAVTLMRPEGPLLTLRWEGTHRVLTTLGPERIGRRWWRFPRDGRQPARSYYRVQLENGQWLWVYRSVATGRWFVAGLWA